MRRHWFAVGVGLAGVIGGFLTYPAFIHVSQLRAELALAECELAWLRQRSSKLKDLAESLRNDPARLEQMARERGFVRPGDSVIKFPPAGDAGPSTPPCRS